MQRDWIDYVSAAGSVATALTLIYIIVKEWKTRKEITDLAVIAKELQQQQINMQEQNDLFKLNLKAKARPNILVKEVNLEGRELISITLVNQGKVAFPVHFENSGDVEFKITYLPYSLENGQTWSCTGSFLEVNDVSKLHYCVLLYYKDVLGSHYYSIFTGLGIKIIQMEIVEMPKEHLEALQTIWKQSKFS